ncbi:Malto-oligosyltrehalose trehalohydrolase [Saccharolobus shibatae]|uniref:Malto-oligosyltrehalose trehalohydrolase n=1 Tax=Saccharolobus shibatae TaxID=2286 RepID=A0A8F5BWC4_9CREN|nr:Malto-oligosyltrehalose trehalohydrolase [Saccharolobus shibatae]
MTFGYKIDGNEVIFTLWAPYQKSVKLKVLEKGLYEMERDDKGYFTITLNNVKVGDRYKYVLDDASEIPDPASRYQPEGVHGPSQIIQESKEFNNETFLKKEDLIIYEIHVGTFAPEGTFEGVIRKLDYLKDLGITAIEIMPIAQFPGKRDWGYDGVYLYAVQNSYGGPEGFRKLVDEAHTKGLGVILDVVYNHVGPEGNYMVKLGPYFSQKIQNAMGINL